MECIFFKCALALFFLILYIGFLESTSSSEFLDCISHTIPTNLSDIIFTPNDTSYSTLLQSTIQNLRFNTPTTLKPLAIITPLSYSHVQSKDLFINLVITKGNSNMKVTINMMFLGTAEELMKTVSDEFPELGLQEKYCMEMSWIESVVYYSIYFRGQSTNVLIDRRPRTKNYFKVKSDYVKKPIPQKALEEIWKWCSRENLMLAMEPQGGTMSEIDEIAIPYPHRDGNLYIIQYIMGWGEEGFNVSEKHVASMRRIYEKMAPYVSRNPREAYVNFRDLDLGTNCNACSTSYVQAMRWGRRYFKGNFKRLAMVKGEVDPTNFFRNEQSIPPLVLSQSY